MAPLEHPESPNIASCCRGVARSCVGVPDVAGSCRNMLHPKHAENAPDRFQSRNRAVYVEVVCAWGGVIGAEISRAPADAGARSGAQRKPRPPPSPARFAMCAWVRSFAGAWGGKGRAAVRVARPENGKVLTSARHGRRRRSAGRGCVDGAVWRRLHATETLAHCALRTACAAPNQRNDLGLHRGRCGGGTRSFDCH